MSLIADWYWDVFGSVPGQGFLPSSGGGGGSIPWWVSPTDPLSWIMYMPRVPAGGPYPDPRYDLPQQGGGSSPEPGLKGPNDPDRDTGPANEPGDVTIPPPPGVDPSVWAGVLEWFKQAWPDLWRTATQQDILARWYELNGTTPAETPPSALKTPEEVASGTGEPAYVDPTTGRPVWQVDAPGASGTVVTPVPYGEPVWDPLTGTYVWRTTVYGQPPVEQLPVEQPRVVNEFPYYIDPVTGMPVWSVTGYGTMPEEPEQRPAEEPLPVPPWQADAPITVARPAEPPMPVPVSGRSAEPPMPGSTTPASDSGSSGKEEKKAPSGDVGFPPIDLGGGGMAGPPGPPAPVIGGAHPVVSLFPLPSGAPLPPPTLMELIRALGGALR